MPAPQSFLGVSVAQPVSSNNAVPASDVLRVFNETVEKAKEWKRSVFLLKADIRKAFDSVSHTAIWKALLHKGVPIGIAKAIMREYIGQQIKFTLAGDT